MPFENKTFVTFDCYGTLIDWEGGIRDALARIAAERGLPLALDGISGRYITHELAVQAEQYLKYHEVLQLAAKRLLAAEGFTLSDADARTFADSIYDWQPFPETHDALAALQAKGYRLVILSNIDNAILTRSIQHMGIAFDGVVTAEEIGSYKPNHGHWRTMLQRYGAARADVLHVAASYEHDIIPARDQGFDCIWINRHGLPLPGPQRPDLEFRDLRPLPDALA